MKAIQVSVTGGPEVLELAEIPKPEVGADDVLIKLQAIGVNFIDTYHRNGNYKVPLPFVPGSEGAGVVEAIGANVHDAKVGDRVAYALTRGSYAEYAVVPAAKVVPIPAGVGFRVAAAAMLQGMTAHYLVTSTFVLEPGNMALVHAGAGGLGLLLTQLAKTRGAVVITTVSTAEKEQLSREAGADHVIRYTETDFAAEVKRVTGGRGVDVVYDTVGKTTFDGSLRSLRPRGLFALVGASSGPVPPFDPQELNARGSLYLTRPTLGDYLQTPEELRWRAGDVFDAILAGKLRLRVAHTYPLSEAARAHSDLEGRRTTGKVLLIPPLGESEE